MQNGEFCQGEQRCLTAGCGKHSATCQTEPLPPLSSKRQCVSGQSGTNGVKKPNAMPSSRVYEAHNLHVFLCASYCTKATGNLHLDFAEPDRAFRFIVGKRNDPILRKAIVLHSELLEKTRSFLRFYLSSFCHVDNSLLLTWLLNRYLIFYGN